MTDEFPAFVIEYDGLTCTLTPVARQEYTNCFFETGWVQGHPDDNMYFRLGRDNNEPTIYMLRPDEMAAIAWVAAGVVLFKELHSPEEEVHSG